MDVLHTNAGSILQARVGLTLAIGHADFYVNGGSLQHGCAGGDGSVTFGSSVDDLIGRKRRGFLGFAAPLQLPILAGLSCSHYRAVHLFKDTIFHPGPHIAFACSSYDKFKKGQCLDCAHPGRCVIFGHKASKSSERTIKYFMDTPSSGPFIGKDLFRFRDLEEPKLVLFAGVHLRVDIAFANNVDIQGGRFFISLNYKSGKVSKTMVLPSKSK